MENAFYNDMPTAEQIQGLFRSFDEQDRAAKEAADYRMQNYFNCVDDYSWGGLCDKAADESRRIRSNARERLTAQMENGAAFRETFTVHVLADMSGKIVSERIVSGRYGDCWLIGSGDNVSFVGVAKKQATYAKKGYKLIQRSYDVEYYYTARMGKNGLISKGRVLNETLSDVKNMPEYQTTHLASPAYFAIAN